MSSALRLNIDPLSFCQLSKYRSHSVINNIKIRRINHTAVIGCYFPSAKLEPAVIFTLKLMLTPKTHLMHLNRVLGNAINNIKTSNSLHPQAFPVELQFSHSVLAQR